jgi:hypothetical protein
MNIEDYLMLFSAHIKPSSHDHNICYSLGYQVMMGKALTEKQSIIAVRLVKKYQNQFLKLGYSDVLSDIESPKFKYPFRYVDNQKSVSISKESIVVKFPFDQDIVNQIRELTVKSSFIKPQWNAEEKYWGLDLNEESLKFVRLELVKKGFQISDEVNDLLSQFDEIENNLENHIPMIVKESNYYKVINCNNTIEDQNLETVLMHSLKCGVNTYDEEVLTDIKNLVTIDPMMAVFQNTDCNNFHVNSRKFSKEDIITFLIKTELNVAFFFDDSCDEEHFYSWVSEFKKIDDLSNKIGAYFRKNNSLDDSAKTFNSIIKENKLNKEANDPNVEWFLLSSKFPKSLVKHNKKPDICVFINKLISTHYTVMSCFKNCTINFVYTDQSFGEKIVEL